MTARTWMHLHRVFAGLWVLAVIPTVIWWKQSILWLAIVGVWGNVTEHWTAYQAAREENS